MISPSDVTACFTTRGDVDLQPVLDSLPYPIVGVWHGYQDRPDAYGMYTRWLAIAEAPTPIVYTQDDDCIQLEHDQLMAAYKPGVIVSTYGHGENPDGLEDFVLMHGGAIMDRDLAPVALAKYDAAGFPRDESFYRYCDLIVGGLTPFEHVDLPFTINYDITSRPNRMSHMEGARDMKHEIAGRVRAIRAGV